MNVNLDVKTVSAHPQLDFYTLVAKKVLESTVKIKFFLNQLELDLLACKVKEQVQWNARKITILNMQISNDGHLIDKTTTSTKIEKIKEIQLSIKNLIEEFNSIVNGFKKILASEISHIDKKFKKLNETCENYLSIYHDILNTQDNF